MEKYHMRKQERQISDENEIREILSQGKFIVIAMCRDNEPYIVSLSYGYDKDNNVLYFHTGPKGLKIDFITCNPEVCATIIDDRGYRAGDCSHAYRSVVIQGRMSVIEGLEEKKHGMEVLLNQLENEPSVIRQRSLKDDMAYDHIAVLKMDIINLTGKKGS